MQDALILQTQKRELTAALIVRGWMNSRKKMAVLKVIQNLF
jgi:hypothetical protein